MANTLTPTDVYQIVNSVAYQATGRTGLTATDTSSFITVGETLLRMAPENTLNALSTVLAKTIFSVRPYRSKLEILNQSNERWGAMVRKVVPLPKDAEASEDWNTDLNGTQLDDGNSVDMYKISKKGAVQLNFYGTKVLQNHITIFRDQLSLAFTSEAEFSNFIDAIMTDFMNDIETQKESESRATLLNFMAGMEDMGLTVVDLVSAYNTKFSDTKTKADLLGPDFEAFVKFFVSEVKTYSEFLTDRSGLYHANLSALPSPILRHTPKEKQRMIMYEPLFIDSQARVLPSIFNPEYLGIGDYEGVNFWQSKQTPMSISITPNILNVNNGESQTGNAVALDCVVGLLYDIDALGVNYQFDYASTTPFNSAGGYFNQYLHGRKNYWNDFTENAVMFVMK